MLFLLMAACASGTQTSNASVPSQIQETPSWLEMEVRYSPRHSLGKRRLDVLTTNNGPSEIAVTEIALQADQFELLPPEPKTSRIKAGTTVAIKTDFGELTSCTTGGNAAVAVTLIVDAGEPQSHLVQVDPEPLDGIRQVECSERMVREAVEVSFGDGWDVEGRTLSTELMITPGRKDIAITLEAVGGMILFALEASDSTEVPLALEAGSEAVAIPVEITLVRCDVHAISQAPDGYAFRAWFGIGDSEPFAISVLAGDSLLRQLELMVDECLGL